MRLYVKNRSIHQGILFTVLLKLLPTTFSTMKPSNFMMTKLLSGLFGISNSVSYTHLDVYKRQVVYEDAESPNTSFILLKLPHGVKPFSNKNMMTVT